MLDALSRCEHLIVGIAQPDAPRLDECAADPHRSRSADNPLTYDERVGSIRAMLLASDVPEGTFTFCRFPIDRPSELPSFVSLDTPCYTTLVNDWNLKKIETLRALGYQVTVLWDSRGSEHIEGSVIRQWIREGRQEWLEHVHPAVVTYLREHDLIGKIVNVAAPS